MAGLHFVRPQVTLPIDAENGILNLRRSRRAVQSLLIPGVGLLGLSANIMALASRSGHTAQFTALHFVCMDWRHIEELMAAGRGVYGELKNLCVWVKDNAGMGSLYRSQHELVFVFKQGR